MDFYGHVNGPNVKNSRLKMKRWNVAAIRSELIWAVKKIKVITLLLFSNFGQIKLAAMLLDDNTDCRNRELITFQADANVLADDRNGLCHNWIKSQTTPVRHLTDVDMCKTQ